MSNGEPSRWFGDSEIGSRFPAWTRGNAADVFPDPFSPLAQSMLLRDAMSGGLRNAYISLGVLDWDEFDDAEHPELFAVFGGYVYNPLSLTRLLGARMPGVTPEAIDLAFFDEHDDVPEYVEEPWHESEVHAARLAESMGWTMSAESLPELDADKQLARAARDHRPDLGELTDAALVAHARSMIPLAQRTFENAMRVSSMASLGPGALGAICEGLGDASLSIKLLAGIEVDSAAPSHAMWELGRLARKSSEVAAAFDAGPDHVLERLRTSDSADARDYLDRFDAFLYEHGSRAQNEYDLISMSWEVNPRIALAAIDLMRRSDDSQAPMARHDTAIAERDRVLDDVRGRLADDAEALGTFESALRSSQLFLSGRERAKTNLVRLINEMRMALREFGSRLVERGLFERIEQIFMVADAELDRLRLEPDRFGPLIADRWDQYRGLFEMEPVFVVKDTPPPLSAMRRRDARSIEHVEPGTVLHGAAGSGGEATGRARIVSDAADPVGLEPGDVLIAPQTDPSWVPLFVPAAAVVVNVGALGSHAVIVSRELGIPCVVSVADATHRIPNGATVTVDGSTGTVTVLTGADH